ncbi:MAG: glycosyltransferase family 39 protein [Candidatus Nomurabacteria bacterium]|jgi:hypothetical protein|nr:glycosyltransferase family 39 protein [Candidatus Nomurabacteria bacterium]
MLLAVFFSVVLIRIVFYFNPLKEPQNITVLIAETLSIAIYALILVLVWCLITRKLDKAKVIKVVTEKKFLITFFIVLILAQVGFATQISMPLKLQCHTIGDREICLWDFNMVTTGAIDSVSAPISQPVIDYLHKCQNNIPVFVMLRGAFKLAAAAGITNFQAVGTALNILAINSALLILYFIARKLWGVRKAILSLFIAVSVLPLVLLYVPVFYTDTLSLPFVVGMFYLYLKLRDSKSKKRYLALLISMMLVAIIGVLIKFNAAIMLIAIVIDMFIRHDKAHSLKQALVSLAVIISLVTPVLVGYSTLSDQYIHNRATPGHITMPPTHYIMMGLGGKNGQFNGYDDDSTYTHSSRDKAIQYNINEIKERLKVRGWSLPEFFYDKIVGTWGRPWLEARDRLNNNGLTTDEFRPSSLQRMIVGSKRYPLTPSNFIKAAYILIVIAFIISCARSVALAKKQPTDLCTIYLAVFGLASFLLIWEASPRYIINYFPFMILLATPAIYNLSPRAIDKIKTSYLSIRHKFLKRWFKQS